MSADWKPCKCGMKRDFMTRSNAEKALGKAQAKRARRGQAIGTRRGMKIEHRVYDCEFGGWHLTSENRSSFESRMFKESPAW
ncbi:hypothetical protein [Streptomyces werraensis]|uniref:hypothetical protein n=1 Tax=Streptomyces werraensis TaxID=68284 RepID=UPI00291D0A0D|nr:hypothetical protein SEA_MARAV_59 [Streptomyces phage Marav]